MNCNGEILRLVQKTGAGFPTIPDSADHRDGTWIATDLYDGEIYLDTDTDFIYIRSGANIITLFGEPSQKTIIAIVSGDAYVPAGFEVILAVASAGVVNIEFPSAIGINGTPYTVKKLDATTNAVNLIADGSEKIEGESSIPITLQGVSLDVIAFDGNWFII